MTAKRSFKLESPHHKNNKNIAGLVVGAFLGASLLGTLSNVQTAFKSFDNYLLISSQSEIFNSSQYQPIVFGSTENLKQQDFTKIDRLAKELNYSGESINKLAELLQQNTTTEAEKHRIIYAWVSQHISYDMTAFNDAVYNDKYPDVDAPKVLRDRTTICSGYSNLYYALAEAMNLESAIVIGYAKGATPSNMERFQNVNHSWNAIKIDNEWYLLDATWGAGSIIEGQFKPDYKPYYFATAPDEFINSHFPQDEGWQLLSQVYSRGEFDNLPNISDRFYNLGIELVDRQKYRIEALNGVKIKLKAPQDVVAIASLKQNDRELPEHTVLVNRQGDNLIVNVAPPAAGLYDLSIYAKQKENPGYYGQIIKYQIKAKTSTAKLPKIYGHFNEHQVSLIEPLQADLRPNWSTYFNLVVPNAIDVRVVNTTTEEWIPLNGYGDTFVGSVDIQSGNTVVVAKFPDDDEYWKLIEYESEKN